MATGGAVVIQLSGAQRHRLSPAPRHGRIRTDGQRAPNLGHDSWKRWTPGSTADGGLRGDLCRDAGLVPRVGVDGVDEAVVTDPDEVDERVDERLAAESAGRRGNHRDPGRTRQEVVDLE